jgi:hypothetical protein
MVFLNGKMCCWIILRADNFSPIPDKNRYFLRLKSVTVRVGCSFNGSGFQVLRRLIRLAHLLNDLASAAGTVRRHESSVL